MPIRTVVSLTLSAYYGVFVLLSIIPVLVFAATFTTFFGIVPLGAPILLGLFLLVLLSAIYAQSARAAASITGLQGLKEQPKFSSSVLRSLSATFLVIGFAGAALAGLHMVLQDASAAGVDAEKLGAKLMAAMKAPATAERTASLDGMSEEPLFFVVLMASMILVTLSAMLVVPRATGLEEDYGRAYSLGLILTRLVIALPFCGLLTLIIVNMGLSAVEALAGIFVPDFAPTVLMLYIVQTFAFTGMMFTFETYLLAIGRDLGKAEQRKEREIERSDTSDIRALREAWSRRT